MYFFLITEISKRSVGEINLTNLTKARAIFAHKVLKLLRPTEHFIVLGMECEIPGLGFSNQG